MSEERRQRERPLAAVCPPLGRVTRDVSSHTRTRPAAQEPIPQFTLAAASRADRARLAERHPMPGHRRRQAAGSRTGRAGSARTTPRRSKHDCVHRALGKPIRARAVLLGGPGGSARHRHAAPTAHARMANTPDPCSTRNEIYGRRFGEAPALTRDRMKPLCGTTEMAAPGSR